MTTTNPEAALAKRIVRDVSELPDRTSPDDWPEAMLVTADELQEIVNAAVSASIVIGQPALDWDWLEGEVGAISCRYQGDPKYDHDAYWFKDKVQTLIAKGRALRAKPAGEVVERKAAVAWLRSYADADKYGPRWRPLHYAAAMIEDGEHLAALAQLPADQPEGAETCKRCGHENAIWSAPSPLWNAVMRGDCINGKAVFGDMVCAACFMALAEAKGIATLFRVTAEKVNVPLQTVTPSGRVWDDTAWVWLDQPYLTLNYEEPGRAFGQRITVTFNELHADQGAAYAEQFDKAQPLPSSAKKRAGYLSAGSGTRAVDVWGGLKACPNPWCVRSDGLPPVVSWSGAEAYIECSSCGLQGPWISALIHDDDGEFVGSRDAEAEAKAAWNERADHG